MTPDELAAMMARHNAAIQLVKDGRVDPVDALLIVVAPTRAILQASLEAVRAQQRAA